MNILRKQGVIDLKLLEDSLNRDDQLCSPETLLCDVLEVDGVRNKQI